GAAADEYVSDRADRAPGSPRIAEQEEERHSERAHPSELVVADVLRQRPRPAQVGEVEPCQILVAEGRQPLLLAQLAMELGARIWTHREERDVLDAEPGEPRAEAQRLPQILARLVRKPDHQVRLDRDAGLRGGPYRVDHALGLDLLLDAFERAHRSRL